jgi:MoxR-like ATPase
MVRLSVGHPGQREEMALVRMNLEGDLLHAVHPMLDADQLTAIQARVRTVAIPKLVLEYLTSITRATREHPDAIQGASPRGSVHLARLSQAWAVMQGRDVVLPEDVKDLAHVALTHRIVTNGAKAAAIVDDALERTPAPR